MELFWPFDLCPASSDITVVDNAGRFISSLSGYQRTIARPGSRLKLNLKMNNMNRLRGAVLQALFARLRSSDSIWTPDHSYEQRGSFPCPELLASNYFPDGVGTWTSDAEYTLSVSEGVLRATRNALTASANLLQSPNRTAVPYYPYAARAMLIKGRGDYASGLTAFGTTGEQSFNASVFGLNMNVNIPTSATVQFKVRDNQTTGIQVGDYVLIPFVSYARCALVDNSPNYLVWSDDLTNSAWQKIRSSITNSSFQVPNGATLNTIALHEDATANNSHFIDQDVTIGSGVDDYTFTVALRRSNRTFARIMLLEGSALDTVSAYINLITGAVTNVASGGASFSDPRASAQYLGNDWWKFSVTGRKLSASTTLTGRIYAAEAAGDITFDGQNQNSIIIWRGTIAKSSVPTRLTLTSGTAHPTGADQSLAGGLNTKGWPANTKGLLLPGDRVQIGQQLLIVASPVDSDGSGIAYLQCYPVLREAPVDETPVIVNTPMGKFMPDDPELTWSNLPNFMSNADILLGEVA